MNTCRTGGRDSKIETRADALGCIRNVPTLHFVMSGTAAAVILCLLAVLAAPLRAAEAVAAPAQTTDRIDKLVRNGGFLIKKNNRIIATRHPDQLFIPASTLKIATSLAALKILGSDYRFETSFYQNRAGDLYIRGNGDPSLVSEEVALIVERLQENGVKPIRNIVVDDSAYHLASFAVDGTGKSLNPYDATNSALAFNFNTINIDIAPDGSIQSAEPQTPTLPLMLELGRSLPAGNHRISICNNEANVLRHTGELLRAFLKAKDLAGAGATMKGRVPSDLDLLYVHRSSKNLQDTIKDLMLYSNNFIANQLFLTCGAKKSGYPATWRKARLTLQRFLLDELSLDTQSVRINEGSGLSRKNRITPRALITILEAFKPYAHLLPLDRNRFVKSGTLTGIYSYAGYFQNANGRDSFVLILNQKGNHRDRLLNLLEHIYRSE